MKTVVKKLSETKVELTFTLNAEDLAIAASVATTKLSKGVKVAGFRKGKAPMAVAAKNIDPIMLEQETMDNAISKAVAEGFVSNKIQAIDRPAVDVKKYVPGESMEFTAETEVLPEIKLGDYKKLKVKTEKVEVKVADVQEIIDRMLNGLSEKQETDKAAKLGDEVVIDFVGKKDGVAFDGGTGNDYPLTLGSNQFIPGFEAGVVGHKTGETFDLDLEFPADYHVADLKGAKVVFTTTLKTVKEVILPELNDEFAAKVGPFTSVEDLKNDIKRELTAQKERENNEKLKDDLVSQLIEISSIPVPEILVNDQIRSIEQDFERNLMYQGMDITKYIEIKKFADKDAWINEEVKPVAMKRVQAGLVLAELSKVEKIEATSEELAAHIEQYRTQYAKNPEALKQFENPEIHRDIANRLITEKTVDRLVEINKK